MFLHIILFDIAVIVGDACAANKDEEDAEEAEAAKHEPAPNAAVVANQKHRCQEQIEETFSCNCFQESEVFHHEVEVAESKYEENSEQTIEQELRECKQNEFVQKS